MSLNVNLKRARTEANIKRLDEQEKDAIKYCEALACLVLRDEFGWDDEVWGTMRLKGFIRALYAWFAESFEQYRASGDAPFSREIVPTVYAALRNQVKALDVQAEKIEADYAFAEFFTGWKPQHMKERRAWRYKLLSEREMTFRAFWYLMMLYLHEKYGFGKTRLNKFYEICRRWYKTDFDLYLKCTVPDDERCRKMIRRVIEEAESLGVTL